MLDLGRFPYIDAAGDAVTAQTIPAATATALTVKYNNDTDANVSLSGADAVRYYVVNNTTGAITNSNTTWVQNVSFLKNNVTTVGTIAETINASGSYTLVTEVFKDGEVIQSAELALTVTGAAATKLDVANVTGHVAGAAVPVEIKALDTNNNVDVNYTKTVAVTLSGGATLTQNVNFVNGVGTVTIPADTVNTVGTTAAITVAGDSLTTDTFTITTVAGNAAAMTLGTITEVQYVEANLTITAIQDAKTNNITADDYVVRVVSDLDGEVFNAEKAVTGGAVTGGVDITLTTVGTHTLTVTVDGFSKTTTATIAADTTAPALDALGIDAATINGGSIVINNTAAAANEIFEAESGVASVVISIGGTNYTGTVNATGTAVTFTGLPTVSAGVNYTITMTDNAGNTATLVQVVQ